VVGKADPAARAISQDTCWNGAVSLDERFARQAQNESHFREVDEAISLTSRIPCRDRRRVMSLAATSNRSA
jgi:hypothetical protein